MGCITNFHCEWTLREFAGKPEAKCRQFGTVQLFAHSLQTLSDFRLDGLVKHNIGCVPVFKDDDSVDFLYNRLHPETDIKLHLRRPVTLTGLVVVPANGHGCL